MSKNHKNEYRLHRMATVWPLVNYIFSVDNVPISVTECGKDTDEGDITDRALGRKSIPNFYALIGISLVSKGGISFFLGAASLQGNMWDIALTKFLET